MTLPFWFNLIKDKNGNFNQNNADFLGKILEQKKLYLNPDFLHFFDDLKDKKGVIQQNDKLDFALKAIEREGSSLAGYYIQDYLELGSKRQEIYQNFKNLYPPEKKEQISELESFHKICYNKNNNLIEENLNFLKEIAKKHPEKFEGIGNLQCFQNEKTRTLEPFYKNKILEALDNNHSLYDCKIAYITSRPDYNYQIKNSYGGKFSEKEIFDFHLKLTALNFSFNNFGKITDTLNKAIFQNYAQMSFEERKDSIEELSKFSKIYGDEIEIGSCVFDIKKIISELNSYNSNIDLKPALDVDDILTKAFKEAFFTSFDGEKLTPFENILTQSISQLKNSKNGLQLSYPRSEFLKNLSFLDENNEIFKKLNINPIFENGELTGYDGILELKNLDKNDELENKVYNLCHKFLYENEVITGNKALDKELNKIIKGVPEFVNIIGKKQHETHEYSLDIHTLLVLANSIDNPQYKNLKNIDKIALKLTCLFHDTGKKEGIVDKEHQFKSSNIAARTCKRFFKNQEFNDRIFELIQNHHWLELWNKSYKTSRQAMDFAFDFRRVNDFEISKIITNSDLMSVSDKFCEKMKNALQDTDLIDKELNKIYSTGSAVFSDYPVLNTALSGKTENFKGKEYKVINFYDIKNDEDLGKYGFKKGLTKKDARFLVHMISQNNIEEKLNNIKSLQTSSNQGVLSQSLISPYSQRTYCDQKYGVLLSCDNTNIINIAKENQASDYKKELHKTLHRFLYKNEGDYRTNFKTALLKNLSIDENSVSDEEYAKFYKENIASKNSLS